MGKKFDHAKLLSFAALDGPYLPKYGAPFCSFLLLLLSAPQYCTLLLVIAIPKRGDRVERGTISKHSAL